MTRVIVILAAAPHYADLRPDRIIDAEINGNQASVTPSGKKGPRVHLHSNEWRLATEDEVRTYNNREPGTIVSIAAATDPEPGTDAPPIDPPTWDPIINAFITDDGKVIQPETDTRRAELGLPPMAERTDDPSTGQTLGTDPGPDANDMPDEQTPSED